MITIIEQQTLDIDWFFNNGKDVGFVASGGGKLPDSIAKSLEKDQFLASFFRSLPLRSEVTINPDLDKIIPTRINETYLSDFIEMAQKGLFSFDKTVLNNFSDLHYHLVAKPVNPLKFDHLPLEIKKALAESKFNGDIETMIDTSFVS